MRAAAAAPGGSRSTSAILRSSCASAPKKRRRSRRESMGQKVHPAGLRLGINRTWDSRGFARRDYSSLLHEDLRLRRFLTERLNQAGVSRIVIERAAMKTRITIHSARPGVVIGKKGADI